jgi:hypothetical protein
MPTSYQDNDPIRRACVGGRNVTNAPHAPAEEVCNLNGTLGLVLPVPSLDFVAEPPVSQNPFPTAKCTAFSTGPAFNVARCPVGPTPLYNLACPDGATPSNGQCEVPVAGNPSTALCENDPSRWPPLDGMAGDGRIFNLTLYSASGTPLMAQVQAPGANIQLPFTGAFARIHQSRTLWNTQGGTVPQPNTPCENTGAEDQIRCLAQASPCSFGLVGSGGAQTGITSLKIDAVDPAPTCVESKVYPLWHKLYLNAYRGLGLIGGPPASLAQCEADPTTMGTALNRFGLVPLPSSGPDAINAGAAYCEDFDEAAMCGASSNANNCQYASIIGLPTVSAVCGNGTVEALEECDNGPLNGPPPAACSTSCRANARLSGDAEHCGPQWNAPPFPSGTANAYVIWYNNASQPWQPAQQALVQTLLSNLANTSWWSTFSQYPLGSSHTTVTGMRVAGTYTDSETIEGITSFNNGGDQTVIQNVINGGHLPYDPNGMYLVLPSASDVSAWFLGEHFQMGTNFGNVTGLSALRAIGYFNGISTPNGDTALDFQLDAIGHEVAESVAYPWLCDGGEEIADLCASYFSNAYLAPNGGTANLGIDAGGSHYDFLIQDLWVHNEGGYCGQGLAPAYYGNTCETNADCPAYSGHCVGWLCQAPTCSDGVKNRGEADVDCGMACGARCAAGRHCTVPEDCTSGKCSSGTCQ